MRVHIITTGGTIDKVYFDAQNLARNGRLWNPQRTRKPAAQHAFDEVAPGRKKPRRGEAQRRSA
jgi:hypothetical protein